MNAPAPGSLILGAALGIGLLIAVLVSFAWGYDHLGPLFNR